MSSIKWFRLTHDARGDRYGWIIGKETDGSFSVYLRGYSCDRFLAAANHIISSATDPTGFLVLNPADRGTAYRLTDVLYAARHSGLAAMPNVFSVA